MAAELHFRHPAGTPSLTTLYAVLSAGAQVVRASTGGMLTRDGTNWPLAAVFGSDAAAAANYLADVPANVAAGQYTVQWYAKAGSAAALDDPPVSNPASFYWTGTTVGAVAVTAAGTVGLSSAERDALAAALLDLTAGVESGLTLRQALRGAVAALFGRVTGADTSVVRFRDTNNTKNRITASVDATGRLTVTLDLS